MATPLRPASAKISGLERAFDVHVQFGLGHGAQQFGQAVGGDLLAETLVEEASASGHGGKIGVVISHSISAAAPLEMRQNVYGPCVPCRF